MSSSRYWPPTSPEDLIKRAEEASVCVLTSVIRLELIWCVETGIEMVNRDCF